MPYNLVVKGEPEMTTGQETPAPFRCPRCGGLMYKPVGSSFYWHADSNHPPCEITNIAEIPKSKSVTDDSSSEASAGQRKKQRPGSR